MTKTKMVRVRCNEDLVNQLERFSESHDLSVSDVVRTAILAIMDSPDLVEERRAYAILKQDLDDLDEAIDNSKNWMRAVKEKYARIKTDPDLIGQANENR